MDDINTYTDSFTIGTPSNGGAFKIYCDDITSSESLSKINKVLIMHENAVNYKNVKKEVQR